MSSGRKQRTQRSPLLETRATTHAPYKLRVGGTLLQKGIQDRQVRRVATVVEQAAQVFANDGTLGVHHDREVVRIVRRDHHFFAVGCGM